MTRKEQLVFCERCTNRKMDIEKGILCSITNEHAAFTVECPEYLEDENVNPTQVYNTIEGSDLQYKVSDDVLEKFKTQQNLKLGLLASISVGVLGAILWSLITVATEFQIGYMAIAIGAGVGYTMQITGKGIDQVFGISGAIIAVLSCFLGNFLSLIGFVAKMEDLSFFETLLSIDYSLVPMALKEQFSFIDLVFYVIAGAQGYKFAFRKFTEEDFISLK
ncbi:MAG: hypothetical protein ACJAYP_001466 [Flavobacterium sp.]|jgi:hypothetical protein